MMRNLSGSVALGLVVTLAATGAFSLTLSAATAAADASARITCRREAALALLSDTHCATRKAGATSTHWGY